MAIQVIQQPQSARDVTVQRLGQALGGGLQQAGSVLLQQKLQEQAQQRALENQRTLMQEEAALKDRRIGEEETKNLLTTILGEERVEGLGEGLDLTAGEVSSLANSIANLENVRAQLAKAQGETDSRFGKLTDSDKDVMSWLIGQGIEPSMQNLITYRVPALTSVKETREVTEPVRPEQLEDLAFKKLKDPKGKALKYKDVSESTILSVERPYARSGRNAVVIARDVLGPGNTAELVDLDPQGFREFIANTQEKYAFDEESIRTGEALKQYLIDEYNATEDSALSAVKRMDRIRRELEKQREAVTLGGE